MLVDSTNHFVCVLTSNTYHLSLFSLETSSLATYDGKKEFCTSYVTKARVRKYGKMHGLCKEQRQLNLGLNKLN